MDIRIPVDGPDQDREIIEAYSIHIAKGWELAARIYARCAPGQGKARSLDIQSSNLDEVKLGFAALARVTGRSRPNISLHWHNWQEAIDEGLVPPVRPGDVVTLPEIDYPPMKQAAQTVAWDRQARYELADAFIFVTQPVQRAGYVRNPSASLPLRVETQLAKLRETVSRLRNQHRVANAVAVQFDVLSPERRLAADLGISVDILEDALARF
jgi:hypothetical protein